MKKILDKAQYRLSFYRQLLKSFGIRLCVVDIINRYFRDELKTSKGKKWHVIKHQMACDYLAKQYSDVLQRYQALEKVEMDCIPSDAPIWFFWYQGIETAPEIIRICLESVKKNAGTHPVKVIDRNNLAQYVQLPDYIMEKVEKGIITYVHLSDIIRVSLLAEHGGIWTDATLYWTQPISAEMEKYSLYTLRHGLYSDYHIAKGRWLGGFLACAAKNSAMCYIRDLLFCYWKKETQLYCFLLIDCIMSLGYEKLSYFADAVEQIPFSNAEIFVLQQQLNQPYDANYMTQMLQKNWIYRISYRYPWHTKVNESLTNYGWLITQGPHLAEQ